MLLKIFWLYSSCSNSYDYIPLQVGTHDYDDLLGTTIRIELIPIRTIYRGLCYKLKLSNPLPSSSIALNPDYYMFHISSFIQGIDKLEKINLMIAENNTWQGIVGDKWPYSQGKEISKKNSRPPEIIKHIMHTIILSD